MSDAAFSHPFLRDLRSPLHISHRGGAALAPENTLAAFRMAVERYRTDMLELDVHQTRDGVLVVSHDPTVDRCTDGAGRIAELTLAELQRLDAGRRFTRDWGRTFPFRGKGVRLPTLEEVLRAFPGLRLNIELKADAPGAVERFADTVRRADAVARVCCGSEHDALAARLYEAFPEGCHFYPRDAGSGFVINARTGEPPPEDPRFLVLDMPLYLEGMRLIDRDFLDVARRHGKWVNVWTVDSPAEMTQLVAEGVGGIMTDRPDLLRDVLGGPTTRP